MHEQENARARGAAAALRRHGHRDRELARVAIYPTSDLVIYHREQWDRVPALGLRIDAGAGVPNAGFRIPLRALPALIEALSSICEQITAPPDEAP